MSRRAAANTRKRMNGDEVYLHGDTVYAVTPEGQTASLKIAELFDRLAAPRMSTCGMVLPDGVKAVFSEGHATVWVYECPPRVQTLRWIADDSPVPFGPGTTYRHVRLSLPYVIVLAVFTTAETGKLTLSRWANECFFRNAPLTSVDDPLSYPALLNCSKFTPPEGRPLSWICTQHLDRSFDREPDQNRRLRRGLTALLQTLFHAGFNYSSESHEGASWYTESRGVDPRIATVDRWQTATAQSPLFVLDVPWLPTGLSVGQVVGRIFQNLRAARPAVTTVDDVARLVFNHHPKLRRPKSAEFLAALQQEWLESLH